MQLDIESELVRSRAVSVCRVMVGELPGQAAELWHDLAAKSHKNLPESVLWDLQIEELLFALHVLDRVASNRLTDRARTEFMDAAYQQVREDVSRRFEDGARASSFRDWLDETYNARQAEYSGFQFRPAGKNESDKSTLFWEVSKRLTLASGLTNPVFVVLVGNRVSGLAELMAKLVDEIVCA